MLMRGSVAEVHELERVLDKLHPQHACLILATHYGIKPSAIVESVEVKLWDCFVYLVRWLKLALAYRTDKGLTVLATDGSLMYFDDSSWQRLLNSGEVSGFKKLSFKEVLSVKPISNNGIDFHEVYVARDLETLLSLVRLHLSRVPKEKREEVDRKLGELLGYPKCCTDNYVALGPVRAWHEFHRKLIELGLDQEMPVELWAIYHAPCSPKCKRSLRLGEEYLEAVKKFSPDLCRRVKRRLSSAHLAFSVGRRFLDFMEINAGISSNVRSLASSLLPEPLYITVGDVLRPLSYFMWEKGEFKLRMTPEIMGRKFIAFSPGNGVLVVGKDLKVFIYVTKELLSPDSMKYSSTAFRVYRCATA